MERHGKAVKETPKAASATYRMQLFVVGKEPNSQLARENLQRLCEAHLEGHSEIEIVDVLKNYQRALDNHVLVAPTLIAYADGRRIVIAGTLSDPRAVLSALQAGEESIRP